MEEAKSLTINSLSGYTMDIKVKVSKVLMARIRIALMLMRLAAWVLGWRCNVEVNTEEHDEG